MSFYRAKKAKHYYKTNNKLTIFLLITTAYLIIKRKQFQVQSTAELVQSWVEKFYLGCFPVREGGHFYRLNSTGFCVVHQQSEGKKYIDRFLNCKKYESLLTNCTK